MQNEDDVRKVGEQKEIILILEDNEPNHKREISDDDSVLIEKWVSDGYVQRWESKAETDEWAHKVRLEVRRRRLKPL